MQQIPVSLWTLIAGIVIGGVSLWMGQHHTLLPVAASQQAPLVDGFFNIMFTIAIALFLVVQGTILIFLIKYRRRRGDNTDGVAIEGNVPLEIFWTAIPSLIVICLGIYSVDVYNQMGGLEPGSHPHATSHVAHASGTAIAATLDNTSTTQTAPSIGIGTAPNHPAKTADLVVNVTGMQFAWLFDYPHQGVSAGELHVPVGAAVQLNLAAQDVIHSFWVPQFRIKQDAIPGIPTQLSFVATKPGTYPVVCAELCGGYHGSMRTQVIVHTPEEFDSWLTENQVAQQQNLQTAIAINPSELSASEFLAPHSHNLGINTATLAQIHK
ncbi:heme/copper-type cytochrome/quinol oxidases, subunit 2 [Nostoc sp. PCC 7524]|uniref:cytochrome c oxidase subunit II n=1 Tax=Nostoc sp. (strain ATCC 29411 / PCC 7524) TaxID=28072 RepID=UPI00029EE366|nr:cytochrome c oxidase subunit II [Nostoc sp. PCC 7524]AFY50413.1 heme/copper-type cytochrome/quinol oxidases, subunit 2 [Nostoc sp. PCC 7524]